MRRHDVGWWGGLTLPSQDVEHDISGMDAVTERFSTGGLNYRQSVGQHRVPAPASFRRTRSIAAGSTQSLNGAPLRRAPGLPQLGWQPRVAEAAFSTFSTQSTNS